MLKEYFDVAVMLTESNLITERPANRFHWARMLRDSGLEVFLVQPHPNGPSELPGLEGLTLLYGGPDALRGKTMRKILNSEKRILFWNYGATYSQVIPRNRGYLIHHASEDYLSPTFPRRIMPQRTLGELIRIMSRANLVISVSKGVFDNVSKVLNQDVGHALICNAYDPDTFYTEQLYGSKNKQFIYQGGVNERLDWELLFRLSSIYPDYRFLFYGNVDLPQRIMQKMPSNFELCGQISVSDLRIAMNRSSAALIPFKDETWLKGSLPLKTFEYLACSLPIFSSPIDDVLSIPVGVKEISNLIPRQEIQDLSSDELKRIENLLSKNTYESRMSQLNSFLEKLDPSNDTEGDLPYHSKNLKVIGWANPSNFWSAVDYAISTSDNEGMPVALIEAQLAGIPVIATDVGSNNEVIENGVTGIITNQEISNLINAIHQLETDAPLRAVMGAEAKIRAKKLFSIERMIDSHNRAYKNCLTSGR